MTGTSTSTLASGYRNVLEPIDHGADSTLAYLARERERLLRSLTDVILEEAHLSAVNALHRAISEATTPQKGSE